jgi:hypothetical protein
LSKVDAGQEAGESIERGLPVGLGSTHEFKRAVPVVHQLGLAERGEEGAGGAVVGMPSFAATTACAAS